jgi:hypothetical protein
LLESVVEVVVETPKPSTSTGGGFIVEESPERLPDVAGGGTYFRGSNRGIPPRPESSVVLEVVLASLGGSEGFGAEEETDMRNSSSSCSFVLVDDVGPPLEPGVPSSEGRIGPLGGGSFGLSALDAT